MSKARLKKPFPWTCSKCRKQAVYDGLADYATELDYDGCTYQIKIPKLKTPVCRNCSTVLIDSEADEHITAEFLRQAKLLTPHKIRTYRERLGLTQQDIASALGIPVETVSRLETGMQIQQRTVDNVLRLFFGLPEVRELLTTRKLNKVGLVLRRRKALAST